MSYKLCAESAIGLEPCSRRSSPLIARVLLLILGLWSFCSAGMFEYFSGLGKGGGEDAPLYLLFAGIGIFSFVIVLIRPTIGIVLAMVIFPFVIEDAQMTMIKLLASVMLFGFFIAWIAGKIALRVTAGEKDYLGVEQALLLFLAYLFVNGGYAFLNGISPMDTIRDLIPISNFILFLIIKRFVKNSDNAAFLEKFQFALMILFCLEFALITAAHAYSIYSFLPVSMSALQIIALFFSCIVAAICFNSSRIILGV